MNQKKFCIIDGNAIIHRAYHALPPLTRSDGMVVNAVYGFASMLLKVISDLNPDYLAVAFDLPGKTFRDDLYKEYKATRVKADQDLYDQIPLVHELVEAFNIPIFTKKGFEADDVIASIVNKKDLNGGMEKIIVTGDKDLLQLVKGDVHVYLLRKGLSEYILFDEAEVKNYFGFGPEQVVDYKAFCGDSSDNIPGVKGIGDKGAKNLIAEFGGIEEIFAGFEDSEKVSKGVKNKLRDGKEDAFMSYKLAKIVDDVEGLDFDLEKNALDIPMGKVRDFFADYNFHSLIKRLPKEEGEVQEERKEVEFVEVSKDNFDSILEELKKEKKLGVKMSLNSDDILSAKIEAFTFSTETKIFSFGFATLPEDLQKKLFTLFKICPVIVGHNLKILCKVLFLRGVDISSELFDLELASYIDNSSSQKHDFDAIVFREFGENLPKPDAQGSLFGIDLKKEAIGVEWILPLYEKFLARLKEEKHLELFESIEMPLVPVLARTELAGMYMDKAALEKLSKGAHEELDILTSKIHELAGEPFNIASSVQMKEVLFEKLELPTKGIKKGKTGYSTAASELEKLREHHEIIPLIEKYRELSKFVTTYVDVFPKLIHKESGRIYTSLNQAVTRTGRLSSSDPNLQNIPVRTDLGAKMRETFIAEPGNILLVADYSQIELRIVAALAKDEKMLEVFKKGEDIHKATAAAIHGVLLEEVTKRMRRSAKEVNFGVLFGMGAFGLASRTGISRFEAQEFIDKYFENFSGVKRYMDEAVEFATENGYIETLFGRRRYIPELYSSNVQVRNSAERMAINMPVQGTEADIMKIAMIGIDKAIRECKNKEIREKSKILLQVHDEFVLETPEGTEEELKKIVKEEMEKAAKLDVAILVEIGVGKSWGTAK